MANDVMEQALADIEGSLEHHLQQQIVKYAAGHHIFCKACRRILDAKDTAVVDVKKGDEVVHTLVVCGKCFDKLCEKLWAALRGQGLKCSALDGRILFRKHRRAA